MKQRLAKIYWTGIVITLIMAFSAIAVAARLKITDTQNHLNSMLQAASKWTLDSNDDLQSLAEAIAESAPPLRVTFLLDTGIILADSVSGFSPEDGMVYSDDREIADAREGKTGSHLRMSSEDAALVLYVARRVSPQLLLRLSYPVFEITKLVLIYGILLLCLFLILYFLQRRVITRLVLDQQRQIEDVRRLLDDEISHVEAVFPEYQSDLDAISYRTKRLREDREEILRTMNLRDDFIANASHELRSPLTSIKGYAEMLDEGLAQDEQERQLCISMIHSESDRMLDVINDILRLSKLENRTGKDAVWIQAAPLAKEVIQTLAPLAAQREITLSCEGDMQIRITEKDLWELLFNLVDNAIRYGKNGGYVRVLMEPGLLIVEDDGIGIEQENLSRIFEQFYRVDESRENTVNGTGLGLSIVKAIVHDCGGSIRVESVCGEGSRFILEFPQEEAS